jgi:putative ATP-binding cassette transporter
LATFQRAIEKARSESGEGIKIVAGPAADGFVLDDLVISLSYGFALSGKQKQTLKRGESVVITGRSGSGKSTLFRALAGIWPFGSGRVIRPAGRILFLPQRPYIPLGTLRHAVTYPDAHADDASVVAALTDAGLEGFAARLDEEDSWAQRLSGGEQQRLAIARALLVKPDWLFLDEATSSLDPQSVAAIHDVLVAKLPGATIVSIAHDSAVTSRHARHLVFERGVGLVG